MHIDAVRFGIAGGLTWGLGITLATMLAYFSGYGAEALSVFTIYPWYTISVGGMGIGFLWGFIDGFIACAFFAWVYNHIHRKHEK